MAMTDLAKRRAELIAWAQSCLDSGDRHGLRDAACDLEIVEARMEERANMVMPAAQRGPIRYATADGSPGGVVNQPTSAPNHPDGPECLWTGFGPIWANCSCPDCRKVEKACMGRNRR